MNKSRLQDLMNLMQPIPDEALVDLSAVLTRWEKEFPTMDREEALVRLLHELSKETGAPE